MGGGETVIYAGIGCRLGCSARDVLAAVEQCAQRPAALAVPDFKRNEPGVRAAAAALGLGVVVIASADLAAVQSRCATFSRAARAAVGLGSVAEAAALAAAGPGGRLVQPRLAHGGATCALAETA
jgi:cobalt-precorrin 5A hydrolase